ncbi:hypothetical protein SLEP1_g58347 [Rubroshorea leprosula]|uniref:UBC core domain-containing protein n=1 Tax=Rubroshorea leprosula TaxID=152421 RepID=A0AAV5MQI9_9ROSI|nr:hypothetical protein SLEP1_g58347 [Rubroshorea leprosula]
MLLKRSSSSERHRFGHCNDREKVADRSPKKTAATETSNKKGGRRVKSGVDDSEGLLPTPRSVSDDLAARHGSSLRQITRAFRYRLLRRAWQPVNPPASFKRQVTDNLQRWVIEVNGAPGTLYANETYQLQVDFPENYLMESPQAIKSGFGSANSSMDVANSPRVFTGSLSATGMERSED